MIVIAFWSWGGLGNFLVVGLVDELEIVVLDWVINLF